MGQFPKISPGDDAAAVVLDSRWLNAVSGLLESQNFKLGRRQRSGGGGAKASIVGGVAIADAEIPAPTELAFSALPPGVQQDAGGGIDPAAVCYKLGAGSGKLYKLIAEEVGGELTGDVYMVPDNPDAQGVSIYNSAGPVAADVPLQVKTVTGFGATIILVDVQKC